MNNTRNTCIACGEEINENYTICPKCHSHRSKWRNELKYWASMTGLIALVVSGVTFSSNYISSAYQYLFRDDLYITDFDTFGESSICSLAGSSLYLRSIRVQSNEPNTDLLWQLLETVEENSCYRFTTTELTTKQWNGTVANWYSGTNVSDVATNIDDEIVKEFTQENYHRENYVVDFLLENGPEHIHISSLNDKLYTVQCTMEIEYVNSFDGKQRTQSFPCIGIIRHQEL